MNIYVHHKVVCKKFKKERQTEREGGKRIEGRREERMNTLRMFIAIAKHFGLLKNVIYNVTLLNG